MFFRRILKRYQQTQNVRAILRQSNRVWNFRSNKEKLRTNSVS